MIEIALPDIKDMRSIIADYLDLWAPESECPDTFEQIIENCEVPFTLFVNALEIALHRGEIETLLLTIFMRDIARSGAWNKAREQKEKTTLRGKTAS